MRWGRWSRMVVAVVVLLPAACGGRNSGGGSLAGEPARAGSFCRAWKDAVASADDARMSAVLEDVPEELAGAAAEMRKVGDARDPDRAADASNEVLLWVEVHCDPQVGVPGGLASERRVGVALAATPRSLRFCSAGTSPVAPSAGDGGAVLYGKAPDPYSGPMLGVVWGSESHAGDGEQTPVMVRGTRGVTAPISVFQQAVLPELGTVVAWEEEGRSVGLYGRLWSAQRAGELVALADRLEFTDGRYRLPAGALPAGFAEVFSGAPVDLALLRFGATIYDVRYQLASSTVPKSLVTLSGFVASAAGWEAFRFLTVGTRRADLDGRAAIVGSAWSPEGGPAVVSWREPDGLVIRIVGLGRDQQGVDDLARAARELTRPQWVELVGHRGACDQSP